MSATETAPSRWLAWTGPIFTVMFVIFGLIISGNPPGDKASAAKIMDFYNSHQGRVVVGALATPLAALLIVLFAAYVRGRARERGGSAVGPMVLMGGAILFGAGLLMSATIELGVEAASDHNQPQVAQTLSVLDNENWVPFIGGLAILLIGLGATVLSSRILPAWFGWIALAGGVVSLFGPGGFVGFFLGPLWVGVAGVWLALADRSAAPATAAPSPAM